MLNKNLCIALTAAIILAMAACGSTASGVQTSGVGGTAAGVAVVEPNTAALDALLRRASSEVENWDGTAVRVYSLNPEIGLDVLMRAVKEAGFIQTWTGSYTRDWELQRGVLFWAVPSDNERPRAINFSAAGETTVHMYDFRQGAGIPGLPFIAFSEIQNWDGTAVTVYWLNPEVGLDALMQAVKEAGFYQTGSGSYTRDWNLNSGVLRWCVPSDTEKQDRQIQFSAVGDTTVYYYVFKQIPVMDGVAWRAIDTPLGNTVERVVYGNGIYIATAPYDLDGDNPGKIAYSTDGVTWTLMDDRIGLSHPQGIIYDGSKFIARSWSYDNTRFEMAYSTDGMTWRPINDRTLGNHEPWRFYYVGGKFFAHAGGRYRSAYSADGLTWTMNNDAVLNGFAGVESIAYGNGKFAAVGSYVNNRGVWSRRIAYSDDGISWTLVADNNTLPLPGDPVTLGSIAYGAGRFVVLSAWGGRMAYSSDGVTWTAVPDNAFYSDDIGGGSIVYVGDRFLVIASGRMAYSTDGVNWTAVEGSLPTRSNYNPQIYCAGGIFFIGDEKGRLWYWKPE